MLFLLLIGVIIIVSFLERDKIVYEILHINLSNRISHSLVIFFCPYRREGEKRLTDHIGELKKQLAARDLMIQRLQKDLKGKDQVHHPHSVFFVLH